MKGHIIVDGGMLSNFPIELFISDEPQVTRLMGPKQDNPVLGLLIDESLPVGPAKRGLLVDIDVKPGELKTVQRFKRLIDTMTGAHDKMVIEEFEHLVVRLPAAGYGTTEFDMSDERRNALVAAGEGGWRPLRLKKPKKAPIGSPQNCWVFDYKHVRFIRLRRLCVMLGRYRKEELRCKESQ
jgi:predicted acylesterase/phospholipase RssA